MQLALSVLIHPHIHNNIQQFEVQFYSQLMFMAYWKKMYMIMIVSWHIMCNICQLPIKFIVINSDTAATLWLPVFLSLRRLFLKVSIKYSHSLHWAMSNVPLVISACQTVPQFCQQHYLTYSILQSVYTRQKGDLAIVKALMSNAMRWMCDKMPWHIFDLQLETKTWER